MKYRIMTLVGVENASPYKPKKADMSKAPNWAQKYGWFTHKTLGSLFGCDFTLTNAETGMRVVTGPTRAEAINRGIERLKKHGSKALRDAVKKDRLP